MRARNEWWIFKDYSESPGDPDWWDGPYKTKAEVSREFWKSYWNPKGSQDFMVVKVSLTPQSMTRKARR